MRSIKLVWRRHLLFKCLYQDWEVSGHVCVCFKGIDFASFYDSRILEMSWQCRILCLLHSKCVRCLDFSSVSTILRLDLILELFQQYYFMLFMIMIMFHISVPFPKLKYVSLCSLIEWCGVVLNLVIDLRTYTYYFLWYSYCCFCQQIYLAMPFFSDRVHCLW